MNTQHVDISQAVRSAWQSLRTYPAETIVGFLLYSILGIVAIIPIIGLLVLWPLAGGLVVIYLKAARRNGPELGDLFSEFKDMWKWVGIGLLFMGAYLLAGLPLIASIAAFVSLQESQAALSAPMILLMILGVVISIAIWIYLTLRWFFVYFAAADGAGILEAFGRSAQLTSGIRLQLLLVQLLALVASAVVSALTAGLGVYFIGPIISLAYVHIYLERTAPAGE